MQKKDLECLDFCKSCADMAKILGSAEVGTEHILLAILLDEDNPLTRVIKQEFGKSFTNLFTGLFIEQNRENMDNKNIKNELFAILENPQTKLEQENNLKKKSIEYSSYANKIISFANTNDEDFNLAIAHSFMENKFPAKNKLLSLIGIDPEELKDKFDSVFLAEKAQIVVKSFCRTIYPSSTEKEILGRDDIIFKIYTNLAKQTKANVILVGDAGVGKSAIAEEIARQIATGECPKIFKNFKILNVDITAAISGTSLRGQFEEKIKALIDYVSKKDNIILFIDEIQNITGAGPSNEGEMNLANMLKPILARDNIKIIGATTVEELNKIQSDKALARRFTCIEVNEPSPDEVYEMIKKKIEKLSKYHNVTISDEEIHQVITYCKDKKVRQRFPDKAIDTIDILMSLSKLRNKNSVSLSDLTDFCYDFDYYKIRNKNKRKEESKIGFY